MESESRRTGSCRLFSGSIKSALSLKIRVLTSQIVLRDQNETMPGLPSKDIEESDLKVSANEVRLYRGI